ncbi:MAG TPA: DUF2721 domain-containing protein [Tepidisphaeraceae bacterium]|nr:DUF2721 domain-containing protein [Tepidisphaeraceae bacterium]
MDWSKVIATGVGPIIVISACGLLCLAFYNRLAAVVSRLRAFQRERLNETEALARNRASGGGDSISTVKHQEMLGMLQVQTKHVIRRAHLLQRTLLCLLLTIACLSICSLCVGLSAIWPVAMFAAVPLFIVGLLLLFVAVIFACLELQRALDPVELESQFVQDMVENFEQVEN